MGRITGFITSFTFLALMGIMIAGSFSTAAEARGFSSGVSASSARMSGTSRVTSFRSVARMKSPAQGGSNTALYAAAYVAILAGQSDGEGARDGAALTTYGVESDISMPLEEKVLFALMAGTVGALILLVLVIFAFEIRDALRFRGYGRYA